MSLESDLQTYMLAETDITSLVGTTGVYWGRAPQGTAKPYITFVLISESREEGADLVAQCGYVNANYQCTCFHKDSADVLALAEAVRTTLGDITKTTIGSTYIQEITIGDRRQGFESPEFGQEETVDVVSVDVRINYNETVPTH